MATPEYHRRQADLFSRLAKVAKDPDTAAELERLAAEHLTWAHRGESAGTPTRQTRETRSGAAEVLSLRHFYGHSWFSCCFEFGDKPPQLRWHFVLGPFELVQQGRHKHGSLK